MDVLLILLNSEYFTRVCTFYILYDFFYCNINFFILQINGIFRFVKLFRRNTFFTSRKNTIFLAERKTILKYGLIDTFFVIKHSIDIILKRYTAPLHKSSGILTKNLTKYRENSQLCVKQILIRSPHTLYTLSNRYNTIEMNI